VTPGCFQKSPFQLGDPISVFNWMVLSARGHYSKPIAFQDEHRKDILHQLDRPKSGRVTFQSRFTDVGIIQPCPQQLEAGPGVVAIVSIG
jgi:hypothetical protein